MSQRKLIRVQRFDEQAAQISTKFSRLEEAITGITPTLCSRPEIFAQAIGMEIVCAKLRPFPGVPELSMYFRYDEETVYLLRAEMLDGDHEA